MLRKESEAVPEGNSPVLQQEDFGSSGEPTLADVYRLFEERSDRLQKIMDSRFDRQQRIMDSYFDRWNRKLDVMTRGTSQRAANLARTTTAAGGLNPTGKTSTATETTFNEPLLRFYATEETNSKKNNHPPGTTAAPGNCSLPPAA